MNLQHVLLQLCTCTWIEIMTCVGLVLYLLYMQSYYLTALTLVLFAPLIGFHFAIERLSGYKADWGQHRRVYIRASKNKLID